LVGERCRNFPTQFRPLILSSYLSSRLNHKEFDCRFNKKLISKPVKSLHSQSSHQNETLTYQDGMTKSIPYQEGREDPAWHLGRYQQNGGHGLSVSLMTDGRSPNLVLPVCARPAYCAFVIRSI